MYELFNKDRIALCQLLREILEIFFYNFSQQFDGVNF